MSLFRLKICIFLFASMLFCGGEVACSASPPVNIYEKHKTDILAEGYYVQGVNVFSSGSDKPISQSLLSRKNCKKKARLKAQSGFYRVVKEDIDWPVGINPSFKDDLFDEYISISNYSMSVGGMIKVDEFFTKNKCVCVLSARKNEIKYSVIDYSNLIRLLNQYYSNNESNDSPKIYFEICEKNKVDHILKSLAINYGRIYGDNVRDVMLGAKIKNLPKFWARGKTFEYDEIVDFELEQLFKLLNYSPYDPAVVYAIGNKLSEKGFLRLASLFYTRGTKWRINPEYNERCLELIESDLFLQTSNTLSEKEERIHQKVIDKFGMNSPINDGLGRLTFLSFGTIPLADIESTQINNIQLHRESISKYLNTKTNSDGFADVSILLKIQGDLDLALAFAIQANQTDGKYIALRQDILTSILSKGGLY